MTGPPERVFHLALRNLHAAAGATFRTRWGWSLPERYRDPAAEYAALRERAVVIDRSQRSRFLVTGTDAGVVLGRVYAGYVEEIEESRAMRTVALDEGGTIRDVAVIARTGGIAYLVLGEPGQRDEMHGRLRAAVEADFDVRIDDRTESTCLIELAGPAAEPAARANLGSGLPARLQTLHCAAFEFHGFRSLAIRTSDTGEDGFAFMLAPAVAQHVIETLTAGGVQLCGYEAAECARVEGCIPAFDPDLVAGLSPAEADLDVLLGIPGGDERRILAALLVEGPNSVPSGTAITQGSRDAGTLGSCVHSYGLNATIALGIIESQAALPGQPLEVGGATATVVAKPFLRRRTR